MPKNRSSLLPKQQQTPAMSPAHPHTVGAATSILTQDEEEDNDICPVCDGECTCNNKPTASLPLHQYDVQVVPSSSSSLSSAIVSSSSSSRSQPLKIKFTVPPSFLGGRKHHVPPIKKSKTTPESMAIVADDDEPSRPITTPPNLHPSYPKRRGRPPKTKTKTKTQPALVTAREAAKPQNGIHLHPAASASTSPSKHQTCLPKNVVGTHTNTTSTGIGSHSHSHIHKRNDKKSGPQGKKKTKKKHGLSTKRSVFTRRSQKRKRTSTTDEEEEQNGSWSGIAELDYGDDDDDDESTRFPTFVSASALSSMDSDNSSDDDDDDDDSDSSDTGSFSFMSDSDIRKEEEDFIVSEVHQKTRLRRELLGDDDRRLHDRHGDWVIRPRKKSVAGSDVEMDGDSDGTEQEEDEDDEDEDTVEEDEEETDGKSSGAGLAGLVTMWSDDEESSFDADLFFSNLTDSQSDSDSSCVPNEDGEEGDHSDMDTVSQGDAANVTSSQRQEMEHLQLEVTEGWDGQIVFTNGLASGRRVLDIDFEVNASQLVADSSSSSSTRDSDVEMSTVSPGFSDEEGYEQDADEGDGDTTDEDLVGEDDLPNERAMKLFSLPFNVSAINPLSTVSPAVSPVCRHRLPFGGKGCPDSPKPEDILSGKFVWDSDEHDRDDYEERRERSRSQGSSRSAGPKPGLFVPIRETRQAIIDGLKDVPSPHPRFNRRRGPSTSTRVNVIEQMLRKHMLNNTRSTPTFTTASELLSPLQLLSSDDFGSPSPSLPLSALTEEDDSLAQSIDLDEVLEASFLAPESSENNESGGGNQNKGDCADRDDDHELASGKHLQNLSRWDLISVGAFRQTRENTAGGGWSSDHACGHTPHSSMDYGSILKASPLSAIMWTKEKKEKERRRRKRQSIMNISPVILPVRDGDRTPTGPASQQQDNFNFNKHKHRSRKETRRERKSKKKNWGPVHHQHSHHQQKYHSHQHHPNSKSRGSASMQRPLPSVPSLSL